MPIFTIGMKESFGENSKLSQEKVQDIVEKLKEASEGGDEAVRETIRKEMPAPEEINEDQQDASMKKEGDEYEPSAEDTEREPKGIDPLSFKEYAEFKERYEEDYTNKEGGEKKEFVNKKIVEIQEGDIILTDDDKDYEVLVASKKDISDYNPKIASIGEGIFDVTFQFVVDGSVYTQRIQMTGDTTFLTRVRKAE